VIQRFERFCSLLAENRHAFTTAVFSELDAADVASSAPESPSGPEWPLLSSLPRTAGRCVEQLLGRFGH
jgi:hypothetical protein